MSLKSLKNKELELFTINANENAKTKFFYDVVKLEDNKRYLHLYEKVEGNIYHISTEITDTKTLAKLKKTLKLLPKTIQKETI